MNVHSIEASGLFEPRDDDPMPQIEVERQIGNELRPFEKVRDIEVVTPYEWQTDQNRPII